MRENDKKTASVLIFIILVFIVFMAGLYYSQNKKINTIKENIALAGNSRETLQKQYITLHKDYENIKVENKKIKKSIKKEQENIEIIIKEIKKEKLTEIELRKFQKKLDSMKVVKEKLLHSLDSVFTINQELISQNEQTKEIIKTTKEINLNLESKNKILSEKVEYGKRNFINDITIKGIYNRSEKEFETLLARKVEKIKISFLINKNNQLIDKGQKELFLKLLKPDGTTLSAGEYNEYSIDKKGSSVYYSKKVVLNFDSQSTYNVYWDIKNILVSGSYRLIIFHKNEKIGDIPFILD